MTLSEGVKNACLLKWEMPDHPLLPLGWGKEDAVTNTYRLPRPKLLAVILLRIRAVEPLSKACCRLNHKVLPPSVLPALEGPLLIPRVG